MKPTTFQTIVNMAREQLSKGFARTHVDALVEDYLVGLGWRGWEARGEPGPPAADIVTKKLGERFGKVTWTCRVSDAELYKQAVDFTSDSLKTAFERELGHEYRVTVTRDIANRALQIKFERLIPIAER